ncbi:peptidoglycan-associated lipoprotein Pal [Lichenibacterium ramalinae]|uniref:Peptidoglycan-associated protein n=1 Tax=Lichenibacterium ramalinae TaxID=2316527 RepID=A0A4Q2RG25_9HYPH|nr:peptidoglycan-associated lipoprotein Pal [Lichenibacterium ramalinae]RYB07137.1 peptidoglycan-associated lipoprotein Pal [Lichenibacterium ramalinae]
MQLFHFGRKLGLVAVAIAGLAIAGCAKDPADAVGAFGSGAGRFGSNGFGSNGLGAGGRGGASTPGSTQDFAQNVGDRVFFDTDQTDLSATAQATLDKQARWLAQYPRYAFTVEGNADERGTREYNFALGAQRAEAVKQYLVARGVSASRIKTISYGKERPVSVCNDISCWSQNRRAVTVLKGAES